MSVRDDIARATEETRAQVESARRALAESREARSGGPASDARDAERQLHALRGAITEDVRALRDRLSASDPIVRRGAVGAAVLGAGAVATLVGSGFAVRSRIRRSIADRGVQRQAAAIARAMVEQTLASTSSPSASRGGPRRRGAALALLAVGAAAAGAMLIKKQQGSHVDSDDLWLPERDLGPS